uniref:p6 n=1 Tax=Pineapple mealybug wilt-associated virus 1 TaxID=180903 RepID=A0A6M4EHU7_9CLOS|nr:p6 [Pineapple mealybug wilt-associated virus 1]
MLNVENFLWAIYLLIFIVICALIVILLLLYQRVFWPNSLPPNDAAPHGGRY